MTTSTPEYSMGWILEYVRASFRDQPAHTTMSFEEYIDKLWQTLEKAGVTGIAKKQGGFDGTSYAVEKATPEIRYAAVEALNYLLLNGLLVYTPESTPIFGLRPGGKPYRLSKRGAEWAANQDPMPEDSAQYMALLKKLVAGLDPVIEQYVSEGLSSFARGNYFAAAVMIGAASEKEVYLLGDALLIALKDRGKKTTLRNLLDGRGLNRLFEFIRQEIQNALRNGLIPYKVTQGADTHFMSLTEAIRVQRNDAVHPQNARVTADSVRLSYHAFPHALEKVDTLRGWLSSNPGAI